MAYKLFFTTTSSLDHISSDGILALLEPTNPVHAKHIAWIKDLELNKCRYSNQDYDVLSAAWAAARA